MPARARCGWWVLGGSLACNPPAARDAPADAKPPAEVGARCVEPPGSALAVLADETCPWALVPSDRSGLALHELAGAAPRAFAVAAPAECAGEARSNAAGEPVLAGGCEWRGVMSAAGPVVVATRASKLREGAEQAYVGAALGGTTVRFVPLWVDRPALGDGTPLGPSLALAPWVCGEELVLVPTPRLAGATAEEPSAGLLAAAGVYALEGEELVRRGPAPDLGGCARVAVELP